MSTAPAFRELTLRSHLARLAEPTAGGRLRQRLATRHDVGMGALFLVDRMTGAG